MENNRIKLKIWWFENKGKVLAAPVLLIFIVLFSFVGLDKEIEQVNGIVKSHQYVGSDYGDIKKLYVQLNDNSMVYVTNPKRRAVAEGVNVCLYKRVKVFGNVSYKFKSIGECT